jgi:hypothetical protein
LAVRNADLWPLGDGGNRVFLVAVENQYDHQDDAADCDNAAGNGPDHDGHRRLLLFLPRGVAIVVVLIVVVSALVRATGRPVGGGRACGDRGRLARLGLRAFFALVLFALGLSGLGGRHEDGFFALAAADLLDSQVVRDVEFRVAMRADNTNRHDVAPGRE